MSWVTVIKAFTPYIPVMIEIVRVIFKKDSQSDEKIRNMEAYNPKDDSISQLQNLNLILNDIKDSKKTHIKELEKFFISRLEDSFNCIENFIKENKEKRQLEELNFSSLRFDFDKLINDFKSSFYDEINNNISLSDSKCLSILEIKAPEKRLVEMNLYIKEIINKSLDKYVDNLDSVTKNTIDFINKGIGKVKKEQLERLGIIKKELADNKTLNENEIEAKRKEYNRKEEIINSLLGTLENPK